MDQVFDIAIIGGGINGCGTAADAALRGLSVVLLEKDDLASKTSSSSTKLIHGGLRYLEHYEFGLVKKALDERQRLLDLAPHIVHPQSFVLPYQKHMRPAWLLKLGLFFYDHLSHNNHLPRFKSIDRAHETPCFSPLKEELNHGFLFCDASTDDARLTIANSLQAKKHGAHIRTQSEVIKAHVKNDMWQLTIQPKQGAPYTLFAKVLVNAAGPWVESIAKLTQVAAPKALALVKGSHFLVPKIYPGTQAYLLQNTDKRIIFVIPYHEFSMIGTTEVAFNGTLDKIEISEEETDYLLNLVNSYFKKELSKNDIVYSWSGVRPLLAQTNKEMNSLSRDYYFEIMSKPAPVVTIYGGKITTYRQLAEDLINQLAPFFPQINSSKTYKTPLPGATFGSMNFEQYTQYAKEKYHWLDKTLLNRYLYTYGSCMEKFIASCTGYESMGKQFSPSLYQVEVDYLILEEWASSSDDILKRRTKLILEKNALCEKELTDYLAVFKA